MLSPVDIIIIGGYLLTVVAVGIFASRKKEDEATYLVGGRSVPWYAVMGSLVATEVSAATFLAVPGVGFGENMTYLQFGIGSILARFFVASVFIGAFYNAGCMSIYEYLGKQFGRRSQTAGSILFLLTRLLASGVRLLIAASGISIIFGLPLHWVIIGFAVLTVIYTSYGGIKAVIWTDCVQALVFIAAGFGALYYVLQTTGYASFIEQGDDAARFTILKLAPDGGGVLAWFNDSNTLIMAIIFGFISTTASLGTDQDLTQRLLASQSAAKARLSVVLSGFVAIPVAALFLLVGVGLHALSFTDAGIQLTQLETNDDAFPTFIAEIAPAGLRGILIAGVLAAAMSSLDSAMAALSSSALRDLLVPWSQRKSRVINQVFLSRILVCCFAVVLSAIAWFLRDGGAFLWLAFKVTSVSYGVLLGLFLLGLLSKRGSDSGNVVAVISGLVAAILSLTAVQLEWLPMAWTWIIVIGAVVTFGVGYCYPRSAE